MKTSARPNPTRQPLRPLTEEEKIANINRFFVQKRESFATGILFNLCHCAGSIDAEDGLELVEVSVAMADRLLEKLYTPAPPEDGKPAE